MSQSLIDHKRRLRPDALKRRAALSVSSPVLAEAVRDRLLEAVKLPAAAVVSGYWPIRDELDVRPLLYELWARGHPICLPEVVAASTPLRFRRWKPGERLQTASFGTQVPVATAPELVPQVLLVPMLAFDWSGYRLGYGGGYYDRTLSQLRARHKVIAIGMAGAGQEVSRVPHDATDQRLDWIVTERDAIKVDALRGL